MLRPHARSVSVAAQLRGGIMGAFDGSLFDKDGTLFDFRATWGAWSLKVLEELAAGDLALLGRLGDAIGFDVATRDFAPHSSVIAHTAPEIARDLLPHLPGRPDHAALVARMNALAAEAEPAPAVALVPLFKAFRERGLRIGLVTNDAEDPARRHLTRAGVLEYFDFVAGFDSGHGAKPDPGPLLAFCAAERLDPSRVVMVGDSRHDLISGRAAGMSVVGVLTGIAERDDLLPFADVVLPDIGHLPDWLDRAAAGAVPA
jgi:phosphoglycolate phosphatase